MTDGNFYPDTRIQKGRIYGKGELAELLGISRSTMTRLLIRMENRLDEYRRTQHNLSPGQVRIILQNQGYI